MKNYSNSYKIYKIYLLVYLWAIPDTFARVPENPSLFRYNDKRKT